MCSTAALMSRSDQPTTTSSKLQTLTSKAKDIEFAKQIYYSTTVNTKTLIQLKAA